ncbi:type IB hybrid histidine kinase [Phycomyces blakesleeanus NRRL 1555(-)]|uniref:Type IB hybrid histidine kinase n=1 Tax=Phycomyces blakesleeanus (strain ATCC 8743b / DSM 1359 / FGSC 10004 / NBRC 33097 / NRRL 1555) TaxID=763407 RepID=A0A162UY51_PHYB8|nr:type IB hybrid histidine kinase [Phycomyces blakesleeanus NRRL 1555(-)]OAD78743.1 type IB hybrid histidine kinase [Phycomyces blakesleeanus NRRL 1555(-)]|eukprot:XP_018296783.1 type IB hybrid histidine kinase [Phycomyces blakesleeanus NRRL 1555(-)]
MDLQARELHTDTIDNRNHSLSTANPSLLLQSLYAATYDYVGKPFLDVLVREIAKVTLAQTVILQEILTPEENSHETKSATNAAAAATTTESQSTQTKRISFIKTTQPIPPLPSPTFDRSGDERNHDDESPPFSQNHLFVRAVYSTSPLETIKQHTSVPLELLQDTPYIQVLTEGSFGLQDTVEETSCYMPAHHSFAGVRISSSNSDTDGQVLGLLCLMTDTPMHPQALSVATTLLHAVQPRVSRELSRIREEEDLKRAKDAAKLDAENKIRFLADMSHEIRTPMNAVIALTDLLLQERSTLNEEQTEHLEVIQTSGHHLLTVINDILDISKINHDPKFKLESRRFSLRKCVKDALNMARHQASMSQQNKLVSVFECPTDMDENMPLSQMLAELEYMPLPVHKTKTVLPLLYKIDADVPDHLMGDTMRLTQILLNLCSNAVKFTKKGGIRVGIKRYVPIPSQAVQQSSRMSFKQRYDAKMETIWSIVMGNKQTRRQKDGDARAGASDDETEDYDKVILEISVTDTGIGIPADRLPRLFRSFSQIDISTARRYGGTGLGLAISSTLVNRMGGGLWVESEEGVGSRFALTLPMTIAPTRLKERTPSDSFSVVLTSPPSPSSTVSDGGGSINENRIDPLVSPAIINVGPGGGYYHTHSPHIPSPPSSSSCSSPYFNQRSSADISLPLWAPLNAPLNNTKPTTTTNHNSHNNNSNSALPPIPTMALSVSPAVDMYATHSRSIDTKRPSARPHRDIADKTKLTIEARTSRAAVAKQHYHHRKSTNNEENLAVQFPIKIMLAEDNVLNQKIAISILKRLGYHDAVIANNGREALDLMRTTKFDVIFASIMDLYMPELDGLEATRAIINERQTSAVHRPLLNASDVYIIALTASASKQDRQICIDAGMNDFISKPFTMMEMKASIKNCVSKRKPSSTH